MHIDIANEVVRILERDGAEDYRTYEDYHGRGMSNPTTGVVGSSAARIGWALGIAGAESPRGSEGLAMDVIVY